MILAQIRNKSQVFDLTADDLIRLKSAGASDAIVTGDAGTARPAPPVAHVAPVARTAANTAPVHTAVTSPIKVEWDLLIPIPWVSQ